MLVVTGGSSRPDPTISMRSVSTFFWATICADRTVIPSMSISASARSTSPTLAPPGRTDPSSMPFGCRAPAARHVQVPSGRALVSSISMRGIAGLNLAEQVVPSRRRTRRGHWRRVAEVTGPDMMGEVESFDIDELLDRPLVCNLATAGPTVRPVWFLWEEACLWILSGGSST